MKTEYTFCRICECLCGLKVTLDENRIVKIEPDKEHVATEGHACVKGLKQHLIYESADRLRHPMKRDGAAWKRISWGQALSEIGRKVKGLRSEHGPDSIGMYVGTATGFDILHPAFAQGFMTGIGTKQMYSPHTQDCANKFAVSHHMYGFPFTQPFPDIPNTKFLIIVGGNPAISKFSFLQLPHPVKKLESIVERGGSVIFIDPRRTESARAVGEHVFIRPDTDVFFYLSFLREIINRGRMHKGRIDEFMDGFDELRNITDLWTPERTAEVTGIAPDTLRSLVSRYVDADGAALYSSTGVNMGRNGALAFWLQEIINAVTGNLDRFGGTLVGRGIAPFEQLGKKYGFLLRKDRSRIGGFASVSDCFPGGILADEILTPGPGQIKALFCTGGNPLNTMANSARLREAFKRLELLVSVDIFLNETASLAHYALPVTSFFEMPGIPFIFPLFCGLQIRPYLQATRALLTRDGEQRHPFEVYAELSRSSGVRLWGSAVAQRLMDMNISALRSGLFRKLALSPERMLSLLLRVCGQPGFKKLLGRPHGYLRPPHGENNFLGKRVVTDNGRINLAPAHFIDASRKLDAVYNEELKGRGKLKLITKRAIRTHNSWMHNLEEFVSGENNTNYLYMHPKDAENAGLSEGEYADVSSSTGTVRIPVKYLPELMPGTVSLPHGWGHQPAHGLSVARKTKGVNVNLLAADGPQNLDRLSGMSHLTGIPVTVKPAEGPHDPTSWSGITE
jgi:anaerobic selenocysteine-containing dehydrogenase